MTNNLLLKSVGEIRQLLERKEASAQEIVDAHYRHVDSKERDIGAFVLITRELALKQAQRIDELVKEVIRCHHSQARRWQSRTISAYQASPQLAAARCSRTFCRIISRLPSVDFLMLVLSALAKRIWMNLPWVHLRKIRQFK